MAVVLENIKSFAEVPQDGCTIVLLHVTNIPHLGIINNNKWYSLSTSGVELGTSLDVVLRLVEKKNIPTLFINTSVSFTDDDVLIYNQFEKLGDNTLTCLTPILSLFKEINGISGCSFIFEVIALLKTQGKIIDIYHLCLAEQINKGAFILREYTMDDIRARINKEVERSKKTADD